MKLTFGEKLRDLRTEKGLTISAVAKATGISHGALTDYENDRPKVPNCLTFKKLADFYDVSYEYLFGDSESKKRKNVDISKETGLSEKAIERLSNGLEVSKQPLCEWLNYSNTLSLLLEDDTFCEMFFSNAYHYFSLDSRRSAFSAMKKAGIVTETTDGSQMFLIGILQAFISLQQIIDKQNKEIERLSTIKKERQQKKSSRKVENKGGNNNGDD